MRVAFWFLIGALVCCASTRSWAEDRDGARDGKGKEIEALVQRAGQSIAISGTVLVGHEGKVLTASAAGQANADGVPLTSTSLLEIASATMPFTAIAVCQLADEGKLDLDDSISKHLPGISADSKGITVRHLLQHTSGIPGNNSQGGGDNLATVIPLFLKGGPQVAPGTRWEYWNQGYALLSEIIAQVIGVPYVEYCRTSVFVPAKMGATCFTGDDPPASAVVAVGSSARGASRSALDHPYGSYGFQYRGMGGIVTNVWDLWRLRTCRHG